MSGGWFRGGVHCAPSTSLPYPTALCEGSSNQRPYLPEAISAEVEHLIAQQQDDGGWPVDFANYSPAAALEWRGHMTGCALSILRPNHKIQAADWAASNPASRR